MRFKAEREMGEETYYIYGDENIYLSNAEARQILKFYRSRRLKDVATNNTATIIVAIKSVLSAPRFV